MHSLANWKTSDFVVFAGNHLEQQISSCLMEDEMGNHFFLSLCVYIDLSFPYLIHVTLQTEPFTCRPWRTKTSLPLTGDGGGLFGRTPDVCFLGCGDGGRRAQANVLFTQSNVQSYSQFWHWAKGTYTSLKKFATPTGFLTLFNFSRLAKDNFQLFIVLPAVKIAPLLPWKRYKSWKWSTPNLDWTAWRKSSCYRYDKSPFSWTRM